jgi:glycine cleavage system H protein
MRPQPPADRRYDPATNLWVAPHGDTRARIGFDPLGAETLGDVVAISLAAPGTRVARGEALGTIEAAKFVGPLLAPISGVVRARNPVALASPGSVNSDPLHAWLVELEPADPAELDVLLGGEAEIAAWFAEAVERYRRQGVLAE